MKRSILATLVIISTILAVTGLALLQLYYYRPLSVFLDHPNTPPSPNSPTNQPQPEYPVVLTLFNRPCIMTGAGFVIQASDAEWSTLTNSLSYPVTTNTIVFRSQIVDIYPASHTQPSPKPHQVFPLQTNPPLVFDTNTDTAFVTNSDPFYYETLRIGRFDINAEQWPSNTFITTRFRPVVDKRTDGSYIITFKETLQ